MTTYNTIQILKENEQDFEWYPTTKEMIDVVKDLLPTDADSIMDIGAGDGRVLLEFSKKCEHTKLYSIEKSLLLVQMQDAKIIPVGTDFYEQNLAALPAEYIFCNPPYSQYEEWASWIISEGYAKEAFLVIPQRWKNSNLISEALMKREATAQGIWFGNFLSADRASRASIEIVRVKYKHYGLGYRRNWKDNVADPFDQWFEQNIDMFDKAKVERDPDEPANEQDRRKLKLRNSDVEEMVESYLVDYNKLETNYRMIFELDADILRELGIDKSAVRDGLKKKMSGLKINYWSILFDRLNAITSRLSTKSRRLLLDRLTANNTIDFTSHNIRAIALWAINNVNNYLDDQLVDLFKELATFEGMNAYKSNQATWIKNKWRYQVDEFSEFALDYRIVKSVWRAMHDGGYDKYDYPGGLHNKCHDLIADMIAVFSNLGFKVSDIHTKSREWERGQWQDFMGISGKTIFQVKGYLNGNVHIRVYPKAMQALNIKAAQLLKWVGSIDDVVEEMGYDKSTAEKYFNLNQYITINNLPMLASSTPAPEELPAQVAISDDGVIQKEMF